MTSLMSDPLWLLLMACTGAAVWATAALVATVLTAWLTCRATVAAGRLTLRACRTCRRHLPHPTRQETTP